MLLLYISAIFLTQIVGLSPQMARDLADTADGPLDVLVRFHGYPSCMGNPTKSNEIQNSADLSQGNPTKKSKTSQFEGLISTWTAKFGFRWISGDPAS